MTKLEAVTVESSYVFILEVLYLVRSNQSLILTFQRPL